MSTPPAISESVLSTFTEAGQVLKPPPKLTVTTWAERERILSSESAAEPGRYRTARAPYQRGMQDAVNNPAVEQVVLFTSAQIGKSVSLENIFGYYAAEDPGPVIIMWPTDEVAKSWSVDTLAPMLRDTPVLAQLFEVGSRKSNAKALFKKFPGGWVSIIGANSAAGLRRRRARVVICDEVDGYPQSAGTEGDPILLVWKRATTFWDKKLILSSTCTIKGASRIEAAYEASSKQKYWVPCPHCSQAAGVLDGFQVLKWKRLMKDKEPPHQNTVYPCEHCGAVITELDKQWLLANGEWRAERPEIVNIAGFWINELYSPFVTWAQMVAQWYDAVQHRENPELLKTFINLSLAETWEEQAETLSDHDLMTRREEYPHAPISGVPILPDGVTVVTAAADVQADRIEVLPIGWGKGEEAWFGPWMRFDGDTAKPEVWEKLDQYLTETRFLHARGVRLEVAACMVDSGYHANDVYQWTGQRNDRRIYASKGISGFGRPALQRWNRNNRQRVKMFPVGVDVIKELVYSRLRIGTAGPGFMHFCKDWHDAEFFQQLTSEKLTKQYVRGFPVRRWEKAPGARNEVLDLTVYAYAAFLSLSEKPAKMLERLREELLTRARQLAAERRAKVDPNQLPLISLPETEPAPLVPTPGPAAKKFHCAQHAAMDPECEVCRAIGDAEPPVIAAPEPPAAAVTAEPDASLGAHEYQVAEQFDPPTQPDLPRQVVVRVRKSGWI